ncbi:hypothetical protein COV18_02795 [Candidatus Woesearchaeota archaeon CG10_big_fil_rev_8_21_14_0_10_37_12]|nr:MAG: hypothetical protein COV18_02795 [Candidatus Woesearchaeota archaeon CG10_big_fil_rev_8_21_14_0_10_37_12]
MVKTNITDKPIEELVQEAVKAVQNNDVRLSDCFRYYPDDDLLVYIDPRTKCEEFIPFKGSECLTAVGCTYWREDNMLIRSYDGFEEIIAVNYKDLFSDLKTVKEASYGQKVA